MLVLERRRRSGLIDLGVEPIQLIGGGPRVGPTEGRWRRGRRAADQRLRRGLLAEVADAGVVGVAVVVLHLGEGVRRDAARVDLGAARVVAIREEAVKTRLHALLVFSTQPGFIPAPVQLFFAERLQFASGGFGGVFALVVFLLPKSGQNKEWDTDGTSFKRTWYAEYSHGVR